mgnify:CR=1 FL=1
MLLQLEPYQQQWKTEFEELQQFLRTILRDFNVTIEHVGCTAVEGMLAKPILDIDIIPQDETLLTALSTQLEKAGYLSKGEQGVPGRFAFKQIENTVPTHPLARVWMRHHLYVCLPQSIALKNHLLFRNALRQNPLLVQNYNQLKINLLNEPGMTKEAYSKGKTEFVLSVLADEGVTDEELAAIQKANE